MQHRESAKMEPTDGSEAKGYKVEMAPARKK